MELENKLYVNEPCVVSFFTGELGWFLQRWQSHLRHLKQNVYQDHKFIVMMNAQWHPIMHDFVAYTIDLPKEFYELGLETDCYESPLPDSPPGSLTPPDVYANLIDYFRNFYNKDKAIEIWTPRGYNTWVDHQPHVFIKYKSDLPETTKPIVCVFPRCRSRASNRNVPAYIWEEVVEVLKKNFFVVLAGTPGGSTLADYQDPKVLNLIMYDGEDKLEKVLHYLSYATLSISSQSGPSHLSLLCGTPSFIIGHEKIRHSVIENRFRAPVSFRYVQDYRCVDSMTILQDLENFIHILVNSRLLHPVTLERTDINIFKRPSIEKLSGRKGLVGAEIGVYAGEHSLNILQNLDIEKLYLIDPYSTYDNLEVAKGTSKEELEKAKKVAYTLLEPYKDKIIWIEKKSEDAIADIKESLDFIYIDGNHTYEYAKKDIDLYYDLVRDGGLVAGHDYDEPTPDNGVIQAVNEFISNHERLVESAPSYDNSNSNDWWFFKPLPYVSMLQSDMNTMCKIIEEEHS